MARQPVARGYTVTPAEFEDEYAYLSAILPPKPKPYTKEWYDQEMEEMEQAEVERYLEAERREAEEWGY